MTNPYKPPASELITAEESKQHRPAVGWKIYFWLNVLGALLMLLSLSLSLTKSDLITKLQGDYNYLDFFDYSLWTFSLIAVYGMAWVRKKMYRVFWWVFFYVFLIWNFTYAFVFPFVLELPTYGSFTQLEDLVFEIPFALIHFYVLFRYVFTMDYLWEHSE